VNLASSSRPSTAEGGAGMRGEQRNVFLQKRATLYSPERDEGEETKPQEAPDGKVDGAGGTSPYYALRYALISGR